MTLIHVLLSEDRAAVLADTALSQNGRQVGHTDKIIAFPRLGVVVAGSGARCQQIELERLILADGQTAKGMDDLATLLAEKSRALPHPDGRLIILAGFDRGRVRAMVLEEIEQNFTPRELTPGDYRWPPIPVVSLAAASHDQLRPVSPDKTPRGFAAPTAWSDRLAASFAYARAQVECWPVTCGGQLVGAFIENRAITLKALANL